MSLVHYEIIHRRSVNNTASIHHNIHGKDDMKTSLLTVKILALREVNVVRLVEDACLEAAHQALVVPRIGIERKKLHSPA